MMTHHYDPDKHHRRSIRLPGYNYSFLGNYSVTLCTHDRLPLFEHVALRSILYTEWCALPDRFANVDLDTFTIMPDHLHCILSLTLDQRDSPWLGRIIGAYKVTTQVSYRLVEKPKDV